MTVSGERSSCEALATKSLRIDCSCCSSTHVADHQQLTLGGAGAHDVEGEPAIALEVLHDRAFARDGRSSSNR